MFKSAEARYALRAGVATVLAFFGALQVALIEGGIDPLEWVGVGTATLTVLGGYLGIGALAEPVEPFIGNKMEPAPKPPGGDAVTYTRDA